MVTFPRWFSLRCWGYETLNFFIWRLCRESWIDSCYHMKHMGRYEHTHTLLKMGKRVEFPLNFRVKWPFIEDWTYVSWVPFRDMLKFVIPKCKIRVPKVKKSSFNVSILNSKITNFDLERRKLNLKYVKLYFKNTDIESNFTIQNQILAHLKPNFVV